jgi:hypothetical protein
MQRMENKRRSETSDIEWQPPVRSHSIATIRLTTDERYTNFQNDMMQWIIDTAPPHLAWGSRRITYEIIAIWFGSVHALSAVSCILNAAMAVVL